LEILEILVEMKNRKFFDKLIFTPSEFKVVEGMDKFDLICKFVYLGDKEIGETIDIYEERLIVKMGAEFAAIPMKNLEKMEGEKIYVSSYDEKDAIEVGKKWVDEKSKPVSIEELKIFGFGEESKSRFSVILKEIGEYEGEEIIGKANENDKVGEEIDEMGVGRTSKESLNENGENKKGNLDEGLKMEKQKRLGEGIIDKL